MTARLCAWCSKPIPAGTRRDAITCSQPCRQARHRVARYASPRAAAPLDGSAPGGRDLSRLQLSPGSPRRLAYADPPYPGKAWMYRDHPDFAGEVDHAELFRRLSTYDGWALSTSAAALPDVLALAVAQDLRPRVAAWVRGPRPHMAARFPLNGWEPVIYSPLPSHSDRHPSRVDVLEHGVSVMRTLPSRVIGAKPAAFCRWMFDLVGATPTDTLDDLFPGSGMVGKTWELFVAGSVAQYSSDASLPAAVGGDA